MPLLSRQIPPAYGTMAPLAWQNAWRRLAHQLGSNRLHRLFASLCLRLAGGKQRRSFDVPVWGSEKARLYPFDNICEKRVFITPQYWETGERDRLRRHIQAHRGGEYIFVDAGANVGLYSLYAQSVARLAGKNLRIVAIEPNGVVRDRLRYNFDISGVNAAILPIALAETDGMALIESNRANLGESRISPGGEEDNENLVATKPLQTALSDAGINRVDGLKIDIEGFEFRVLSAYFATTVPDSWPGLIIIEIQHAGAAENTLQLCQQHGYVLQYQSKKNLVFTQQSV